MYSLNSQRQRLAAFWNRLRHESGAGMAEYTFLLLLIAVALISIFQDLATEIGVLVQRVADAFTP